MSVLLPPTVIPVPAVTFFPLIVVAEAVDKTPDEIVPFPTFWEPNMLPAPPPVDIVILTLLPEFLTLMGLPEPFMKFKILPFRFIGVLFAEVVL